MGKSKKPERQEFPHVLPKDYLESMADKLHKSNPSKPIVLNTITDIWKNGYGKGYDRKKEETLKFRQKRIKTFDAEWQEYATYLDDMIHDKTGKRMSFPEWQKEQADLLSKRNELIINQNPE